jgi:hypothetical protein
MTADIKPLLFGCGIKILYVSYSSTIFGLDSKAEFAMPVGAHQVFVHEKVLAFLRKSYYASPIKSR